MRRTVFLFDLDATVTREEILPALARQVGLYEKMQELTENAMAEELPFGENFRARVEMLKSIPVSHAAEIVAQIPLDAEIVRFIRAHREDCYILTGNLDVWTEKLVQRIGLPRDHYLCSTAAVEADRLLSVTTVLDKGAVMGQFSDYVVAVGDGSNDAKMIRLADVGIGFGGVRPVAPSLMRQATHLVYDSHRLCSFLETLCGEKAENAAVIDCTEKSQLLRQLERLSGCSNVRVVLGQKAEGVIDAVNAVRRDVLFVCQNGRDYSSASSCKTLENSV